MYRAMSTKRRCLGVVALMMAVCICFSGLTAVSAAEAAYAYVNNPTKNGYLNLRTEPEKSAGSLGRYYSGVKVELLDEKAEDGWYRVRVGAKGGGSATGYMLDEFLAVGADESEVHKANHQGMLVDAAEIEMKSRPHGDAAVIATYQPGTQVDILGFISGWMHVEVDGKPGYISHRYVQEDFNIASPDTATSALVNNPDPADRLKFRGSASKGGTIMGGYRNGAEVEVVSYRPDWTLVKIGGRTGYMMSQYLSFDSNPQDVVSAVKIGEVDPIGLAKVGGMWSQPTRASAFVGQFPRGTYMEILGDVGNWRHVRIGDVYGYMPVRNILETDMEPVPYVGFERLGFGVVAEGSEATLYQFPKAKEELALVTVGAGKAFEIEQLMDGGWVQASFSGNRGFVRQEGLTVYMEDELAAAPADEPYAPGEYIAGKNLPAGVYVLQIAEGETGHMELGRPGYGSFRTYEAEGAADYTVYLPENVKVSLKSGSLLPLAQSNVSDSGMSEYEGSGRFLVGMNLANGMFQLALMPGAEAGSFTVMSLDGEGKAAEALKRVEVVPEITYLVEVEMGQLVEIENCTIKSNG